ncbi:class I SAM-dependent methyltransferase [bacterium]|nr:class I SAM-dependent methyltransferase [bacterium]
MLASIEHRLKQLRVARLLWYHAGEDIRFGWFKRLVRGLLPKDRSFKILDAGAGEGRYAFFMAQRYPKSFLVAMDTNKRLVARCQERQQANEFANLMFIAGDLTKAIKESDFDFVYCVDVLEHISYDQVVLENFHRCLRARGLLLLHVPQLIKRRHLKRFERHKEDGHMRDGYVPTELCNKLRSAGFEPVSQTFSFGGWGALAWEIWMLSRCSPVIMVLARPLVWILSQIELYSLNKQGNGLWILARRQHEVSL